MVVLTRAPMAPDVASDKDSRSKAMFCMRMLWNRMKLKHRGRGIWNGGVSNYGGELRAGTSMEMEQLRVT